MNNESQGISITLQQDLLYNLGRNYPKNKNFHSPNGVQGYPMNPDSNPNLPEKPQQKTKFPRSLDPGWATFLAALLALIGTIIIVLYPRVNQPAPASTPTPIGTQSSQPGTPTITPTYTPTQPPTMTATPAPSLTPESSPTERVIQPTTQLFGGLSASESAAIQPVFETLMQAAKTLPLVIRDGFDTHDYGWDEFKDTFEKGIQCELALRDSQYHVIVTSTTTSGGAWCLSDIPRSANDFYLAFDANLSHQRIAEVLFYYRYRDENNFYYLILTPQTQTITLGVRQNGKDSLILQNLYIPAILKDEPNRITMLTLGDTQALSINDSGVALLSNAPAFETGQIRLGLRLNEADQIEELQVDNFELRGE